jgi:hypothetical protein
MLVDVATVTSYGGKREPPIDPYYPIPLNPLNFEPVVGRGTRAGIEVPVCSCWSQGQAGTALRFQSSLLKAIRPKEAEPSLLEPGLF